MQKSMAPNKPFFAYYAPGTAHAPHHAPKEWIEKFKGKFDQGWDKQREMTLAKQKAVGSSLPTRSSRRARRGSNSWDFAQRRREEGLRPYDGGLRGGALAHADHQMGRIVDAIEQNGGQLDNTLIIYIQGDNGASAKAAVRACSTR